MKANSLQCPFEENFITKEQFTSDPYGNSMGMGMSLGNTGMSRSMFDDSDTIGMVLPSKMQSKINFFKYRIDTIPWQKQMLYSFTAESTISKSLEHGVVSLTVSERTETIYFVESNKIWAVNSFGDSHTKILIHNSRNDVILSVGVSDRNLFYLARMVDDDVRGSIYKCHLDGSECKEILRVGFVVFILCLFCLNESEKKE